MSSAVDYSAILCRTGSCLFCIHFGKLHNCFLLFSFILVWLYKWADWQLSKNSHYLITVCFGADPDSTIRLGNYGLSGIRILWKLKFRVFIKAGQGLFHSTDWLDAAALTSRGFDFIQFKSSGNLRGCFLQLCCFVYQLEDLKSMVDRCGLGGCSIFSSLRHLRMFTRASLVNGEDEEGISRLVWMRGAWIIEWQTTCIDIKFQEPL